MEQAYPLIAVIDDDPAYIDATVALLQEEGYQCVSALTEGAAVPLIQHYRPDLVILDLRMNNPDSGLRILEHLRGMPATAMLPVLVCSGDRITLHNKKDWLRSHGCAILEKPFAITALVALLHRLLGTPSSDRDSLLCEK